MGERAADDRPTRYVERDAVTETVVYRASGVGGCIRAMVAAARGEQPRPHQQWFQDVLDEGTRMEDEILRQFTEKSGIHITDTQPEVELEIGMIEGRRVIVRGHMDGIGVTRGSDERWVVEAKKFRPSTYGPFTHKGADVNNFYPWQVSIYMYGTASPCKFVGGLYRPATDDTPEGIDAVLIHTYMEAPISLAVIKARVAKVERLINEGYGADEVECSGNYPCGFWFLHDAAGGGSGGSGAATVELPSSDELAHLIGEWTELAQWIKDENAIVKNLEASKKDLAAKLREMVAVAGAPADARKFIAAVGDTKYSIAWTKSTVPEKTTKAYQLDYFTVKAVKEQQQERTNK